MLQEFIDKYIAQCMKLCRQPGDCRSNRDVRRHNKAMDTLREYAAEISRSPVLAKEAFSQLLAHESVSVRLSAAAACLKYGICVDPAVEVLRTIEAGDDKMSAFTAEMTLKVWQGHFPGHSL